MMSWKNIAIIGSIVLTITPEKVSGHAQMMSPTANWGSKHPWGFNSPSGTISQRAPYPPGSNTGDTPEVTGFAAWYKSQTKYKSVYEYILDNYTPEEDKECGVTDRVGAKQPLPPQVLVQRPSHPGPCEIWCDDVMAAHHDECQNGGESVPVEYDVAKCQGKNTLRWVWLALHTVPYQIYINCATLEGGTGTYKPINFSASPPATTPAPTTMAPPTTTPPTTAPPTTKPPTMAPPTSTPSPAPSSGGLGCNYQGQKFKICRTSNLDAWSYENGSVCVGITRCVKQPAPYGVISL